MKKAGTRWIMQTLTATWDRHPDGTVHHYDYFLDESGEYIYNIDFHHDGQFAPIQLREPRKIPIAQAIEKARDKYKHTTWTNQPNTDY